MQFLNRRLIQIPALILTLLALSSCSNNDDTFDWQIPLPAPLDQHESNTLSTFVPNWATAINGEVTFTLLQKSTTNLLEVNATSTTAYHDNSWSIQVLGLAQGLRMKGNAFLNDKSIYNPAAFVEIIHKDEKVYRGWMYQEFPELFNPDISDWKIWIKSVRFRE
ncbi:MAG: DUF2155 domain-containing protein [Zetaproteobacteria bacterium]|nr:DUF2155 domain-containing protein [Zetaproteobacteria bacterium]